MHESGSVICGSKLKFNKANVQSKISYVLIVKWWSNIEHMFLIHIGNLIRKKMIYGRQINVISSNMLQLIKVRKNDHFAVLKKSLLVWLEYRT